MKKVWFITGSQHLYGPETLKEVADHVTEMVNFLNYERGELCLLKQYLLLYLK